MEVLDTAGAVISVVTSHVKLGKGDSMLKRLAVISAGACMFIALVGASTASATVLCKTEPASHVCPAADIYGTGDVLNYQLKEGTVLTLQSGPAVVECSAGKWNTSLTAAGGSGAVVGGTNSLFSLTGCNHEIKTIKPGQMSIAWVPGTHDGTLTISSIELELRLGATVCKYGGTIDKLKVVGGKNSKITGSVLIPRISGVLCKNPSVLSMEFVSSQPVYVTES